MGKESFEKWLTEQVSYLERMKSEPDKFAWDADYDYQLAAFRMALERLEPAHIDWEAWTAEWLSEDIGEDIRCQCSKCGYPVSYFWGRTDFCPSCGKAMTPEACAELEKRLRW